ncbi:MAG TPA: carbon monoxide dehydrogenase subunit G [Streptosporangiaceae bacterium]|nr:carbon monoxide dehydrogenase subunit G [Streptosporangiaceae bacterium]
MKVTGEATVGAPAETVWAALHDQAVLARAVPGCEQLEITGPGAGRFIVTTTMTAISGTYSGRLTVCGQQAPSSVELTASALGDQCTVTADLTIQLTPTEGGATLVSYEANGTADGSIAGVGTRLLASAAKRLADEFLASLDEEVARSAEPVRKRHKAESASAPKAPELKPDPGPASPASPGSSDITNYLDAKTGALVGAVVALIAIVILLGRRGRRARSSQS